MKKVIFSAFALLLVVAISSCRETTEEKIEETVEDTTSQVEEVVPAEISEEMETVTSTDSTLILEKEAKQ